MLIEEQLKLLTFFLICEASEILRLPVGVETLKDLYANRKRLAQELEELSATQVLITSESALAEISLAAFGIRFTTRVEPFSFARRR